MKIVFSTHALLKLNQRALDKLKIIETVMNPDFTQPSYSFREARFKRYANNHLKVVVTVKTKHVLVVTAHWVAKLKP